MAGDDKKPKTVPAPKPETAAAKKDESVAKSKSPPAPDAPKTESAETAAVSPSTYSRGEGQKPVSQAYKDNWTAIYGKKKKKKR
jgi:hypothetical protein